MPKLTNNQSRAQRGRDVLDAYIVANSGAGEDRNSVLADVLADLMHACDADCEKPVFNAELDMARQHFDAERRGDE